LFVRDANHWFKEVSAPACTTAPNPAEVSIEVKGQPALELKVGAPVLTTLSNDDLDWTLPYDSDAYQCGPCREVHLTLPPQGPALVHVRWTSSDPIHLWLIGEGSIGNDVNLKLAELVPVPGERAMTMVLPATFWTDYPWLVYVGLPLGSRSSGGFSGLVTVQLELESVPQ